MDLVSEFIARYRKEFDFYEQSCRMVAQILESNLRSTGLRAIVTSRAKNPSRLQQKVEQRAKSNSYTTVESIYDDIVDLAGVRVALYFPGEDKEVEKIIRELFDLVADPKIFPAEGPPLVNKRFSGYSAKHYRIKLREVSLNEVQKRYSEASVEIQVASVLMHAWSEVEHDLVYKPMQGTLSEDEYAILDQLNGLVMAGEIALERLQRAGELRASQEREFSNHYDLAAALLELTRVELAKTDVDAAAIGRVDVLFELLKALSLNTPDELKKYVQVLHTDFERRPLSEQIIDRVLEGDPARYETYERLRLSDAINTVESGESPRSNRGEALSEFLLAWIRYEKYMRSRLSMNGTPGMPTMSLLKKLGLPPSLIAASEQIRFFRNTLVHGIEAPDEHRIRAMTAELEALLRNLEAPPAGELA